MTEEIPQHLPTDHHDVCPVNKQRKIDAATTAIDSWFEQHHRILVAYLSFRFKSRDLAREVAQQTYEQVRRASPSCKGEELRRYVFRVATTVRIDAVRFNKRHLRIRALVEPDEQSKGIEQEILDEEENALAAEQIRRLPDYLRELPVKYQLAIAEYNVHGATQKAIAKSLGVSQRMVNSYISYATVYCRLRLTGISKEEAWKQRKVRV